MAGNHQVGVCKAPLHAKSEKVETFPRGESVELTEESSEYHAGAYTGCAELAQLISFLVHPPKIGRVILTDTSSRLGAPLNSQYLGLQQNAESRTLCG